VGNAYEKINTAVVHVNEKLAEGYGELGLEMPSDSERENVMEGGMLETSRTP
jgi:carbonic anhydrase